MDRPAGHGLLGVMARKEHLVVFKRETREVHTKLGCWVLALRAKVEQHVVTFMFTLQQASHTVERVAIVLCRQQVHVHKTRPEQLAVSCISFSCCDREFRSTLAE